MTGDLSEIAAGLGDVGAGAATARALEPNAGEGADPGSQPGAGGHTHETACLNCGTALVGPHCHECGQRGHVHRTIGAFFHDLLHGVLHFEGKTWRTIPLLVWKPGQLTREYIDGKRASYVSPIALFLFVVFLSFALFNALGGSLDPEVQGLDQAKAAYAQNDRMLAELRAEQATASGARKGEIAERIASLEDDQEGLQAVVGAVQTDFSKATVLTLYLLPNLNLKLRPTILSMKPGTRVVSHAFTMDDWQPDEIQSVEGRTAYLWIVPAKVEGTWRWGGSSKYEALLQQHFQQVEGLAKVNGKTAQFRNAHLKGNRISFSIMEYSGMGNVQHDYNGLVSGDTMEGTVRRSDSGAEEKWVAKRAASAAHRAPGNVLAHESR